MASKRMFSSVVVGDDNFRLMTAEAQLLYYTFGMEADDYGIVGSPVSLARAINVSVEAITELEDNEFVLIINRLVVIRHWNVNNTLRDDRLTPTNYPEVLNELEQDKNGVYWLKSTVPADVSSIRGQMSGNRQADDGNPRADDGNPRADDGNPRADDGIEREDKDKNLSLSPPIIPPTPSGAEGTEGAAVVLTDEEKERLTALMGVDYLELYLAKMQSFIAANGREYKNPSATIEKWYREDRKDAERPPGERKRKRDRDAGSFDTDEFFSAALRKSYETEEESG